MVRIDTTAPGGALALSPDRLWPPNHRLVTITPTISTTDNLSAPVTVSAPLVTSNEPQSGDPGRVVDGDTLQLRAERASDGTGRVYTVTYNLLDQAGNTAALSATVMVPHNP